MPNRVMVSVVTLCIAFYGCAGRTPNPVMVQQYGDEKKSCTALQRELTFIEGEITRMIPDTNKTGSNIALGVAGAFLLVPWFFMDFSKAEQVEVDAYRRRYNHLVILAGEKNCGFDFKQVPDFKQPQPEAPEGKK